MSSYLKNNMILQRTQIMYDNKDQEMKIVLDEIFQTNCPELDIGKRAGWTSYIDFINPDELANAHVMKGKDVTGRKFIVFKSEVQTREKKNPFIYYFFSKVVRFRSSISFGWTLRNTYVFDNWRGVLNANRIVT